MAALVCVCSVSSGVDSIGSGSGSGSFGAVSDGMGLVCETSYRIKKNEHINEHSTIIKKHIYSSIQTPLL